MNPAATEWSWMETTATLTLTDLANVCGLDTTELDELVEYGALLPVPPTPVHTAAQAQTCVAALFSSACVAPLRTAVRLRRDYDLDLFSVGLMLEYLNRIDTLERQVRWLQTQNPMPGGLRPLGFK